MRKWYFNLWMALLISPSLWAQIGGLPNLPSSSPFGPPPAEPDTAAARLKPKIVKDYRPSRLAMGVDAIPFVKNWVIKSPLYSWEATADIDFWKWHLVADYGFGSREHMLKEDALQRYTNRGNYFRIGVDVNFLMKDPDRNMFFIGARMGFSRFSESLTYHTTSAVVGMQTFDLQNENGYSRWFELVSGIRIKIWRGFHMGYTCRLKFNPSTQYGHSEFNTYDIPGYGLIHKAIWWGFNYQLYYYLRWRKTGALDPSAKK